MSHIGKNIRKIRTIRKLSQSAFATVFNLARTSVGAYEEGRAEPKIDTIIQIANYFGVSITDLLTKELTVNDLYHFDIFKDRTAKNNNENKILLPSIRNTQQSIPFVKIRNYNEYYQKCKIEEYIYRLPVMELPDLAIGNMRAFELKGSEMLLDSGGMYNGDILVTKAIDLKDLELDQIYVFVTNHGIFTRRLANIDVTISLKADNVTYDSIELGKNEVIEIWKLYGRFTTYFKKTQNLEQRVFELEKNVQLLLQKHGVS